MTLTGKKRYRSERRWGREQLVLQVEECVPGHTCQFTFEEGPAWVRWRDATTADLTEVQP